MPTLLVKTAANTTVSVGYYQDTGAFPVSGCIPVALGNEQIAVLNSAATASLQSAQISALNSTQTAAFQTQALASLSSAATAALQTAQIVALNSTQTAAFQTQALSLLSGASTAALQTAANASLSLSATAANQTAQLAALAGAATSANQTQELVYLSLLATAAYQTQTIATLQGGASSANQTAEIALLQGAATSANQTAQLAALTGAATAANQTAQLAALTGAATAANQTSQISNQTAQLALLQSAATAANQTAQLAALTGAATAANQATQIAALSSAATAALQSTQISILQSAATSAYQTQQIAILQSGATSANQTAQLAALQSAATSAYQTAELAQLTAMNAKMPALVNGSEPVIQASPKTTRHDFSAVGASLLSPDFTQLSLGTGMAVSQNYGQLTLTTGTSTNQEFMMRSVSSYPAQQIFRWRDMMSQRILNNTMVVELADQIGTGLAFTTDGTSIVVTIPGNPFTSANIGQWMSIGAVSGVATYIPGRYAITAVSGNDVTFSAVAQCTWTRSTTTLTVTAQGGGFGPVYIAQTQAVVTACSDVTVLTGGAVPTAPAALLTQSSTAGFGSIFTMTCANLGAASGTLTLQKSDAWTAGSGTLTLFGWNSISVSYHTASNTTAWFESFRNGWGIGASSITVSGSAAAQNSAFQNDGSLADLTNFNSTTNTTYAGTTRGTRMEDVPVEGTLLYVFVRIFNGTTAPATTTTCNFDNSSVEETGSAKIQIAGSVQNGAARGIKADILSLPTLSTVTTVSTVSNSQTALPLLVADIASATLSSNVTGTTVTPATGCSYSYNIAVTAVTGSGIMDFAVQESDDTGTNWFDVYHFPRITATGSYHSPLLPLVGNRVRINRAIVSGTSITASVNRLQSSQTAKVFRQIFDRTNTLTTASISLVTASTTTPVLQADNAQFVQLIVSQGAGGAGGVVVQLQGSDNNSDWFDLGSPLLCIVSGIAQSSVSTNAYKFIRAITKTGVASSTLTYVQIKATQDMALGTQGISGVPAQTNYSGTTSSAQMVAANTSRKALTITNEGPGVLYVTFGTVAATSTNYTVAPLAVGDFVSLTNVKTAVQAISASTSLARVTELF